MWKEILPENCPPVTAKEIKAEVYRILKYSEPTEDDFKPYARLYKDNPRYKALCKAYAVSFYDTLQNATIACKDALTRGKKIGSFIGQFELREKDGRNEYQPNTGHYSTWLYDSWDYHNFRPSLIVEIT